MSEPTAPLDLSFQEPLDTSHPVDFTFGLTVGGGVDLVFSEALNTGHPVNLKFGSGPEVIVGTSLVAPQATLPPPQFTGSIRKLNAIRSQVVLPAPSGRASLHYDKAVYRGPSAVTGTAWQLADHERLYTEQRHQVMTDKNVYTNIKHQDAQALRPGTSLAWQDSQRTQRVSASGWQDGTQIKSSILAEHDNMIRLRNAQVSGFQDGIKVVADHKDGWQERFRRPRPARVSLWGEARPAGFDQHSSFNVARPLPLWYQSRWQVTRKPPAGRNNAVVPPEPKETCYTPPLGSSVPLLFVDPFTGGTSLLFRCKATAPTDPGESGDPIIVPIKRVYIVLNESSLRRVDGNISLPTLAMSLSLDVDSWTWSFSATLPGSALPDLEPASAGEPVLVEALINGVAYRMQVESRSRDRSFGQTAIKIGGRGVAATLDGPYAPVLNYGNVGIRTAQQLMNDVLTLNGVSIGWTIDWKAVDWTVPAGVFSQQGSYIAALNVIAAAAGSYIQPHRTDQVLHVLPRYPYAPWDWSTAPTDYDIPADVATVEGIEWIEKASYNRVFVSGVQSGVLGQVTRTGTDGSNVAPMVTDPLITTADAARQRGLQVLADTGSQASITLRMPVLSETGIIVPGKMLKYTDGSTVRRGITRSVQVDVGSPEIWQTIQLETHA